jgi:hypothetical protein
MTIDPPATLHDVAEHHDELVQFVYRAAAAPGLVANARSLLAAAPTELAASFEQAMLASEFAS